MTMPFLPPDVDVHGVDGAVEPAASAGDTVLAELMPWLKTRARKLKGTFDPAVVELALAHLPGWRIRETTTLLPVNGTTSSGIRDHLEQRHRGQPKQPERINYLSPDDRQPWVWYASLDVFDPTQIFPVPVDKKGKMNVESPVVGAVYVSPDTIISMGPEKGKIRHSENRFRFPVYVLYYPHYGVRAWVVTAPDGAEATILDRPRYGRNTPISGDGLWKWAYEHGLHTDAARLLPSIEEQERQRLLREAAAKGRGTCQICWGTRSLHTVSGALVQHGYQMDMRHATYGHLGAMKGTGDCEGTGFLPWERDKSRAEWYLANQLRPTLANRQAWLSALQAGKVEWFLVPARTVWSRTERKNIEIPEHKTFRGEPEYEAMFPGEVRGAELGVQEYIRLVAAFERALARWPVHPLAR